MSEVLANVRCNLRVPLHVLQGLHKVVYPHNDCPRPTGFPVTRPPLLQESQFLDNHQYVLCLERQTSVVQWYPPQMQLCICGLPVLVERFLSGYRDNIAFFGGNGQSTCV
jgi:hypothetical protein